MNDLEASLLAEAERLHSENVDAMSRRVESMGTTVFMYGPGAFFHRKGTHEAALALVRTLQGRFDAVVFPCCGFAITETLVLDQTFPDAKAIFMDRHVDRRVRRRPCDLEATSFHELAGIVRGLEVRTLVVGINSMVSDDQMRKDPGFPAFLAACVENEHVHRDAVLAWVEDLQERYGYALVPLEELPTFDWRSDHRAVHRS